jgi:hypothetical protein
LRKIRRIAESDEGARRSSPEFTIIAVKSSPQDRPDFVEVIAADLTQEQEQQSFPGLMRQARRR